MTKQLIVSKPKKLTTGPRKGQDRYPKDKAAGVAILLSNRMEKKVMSFGTEGNRVCWVRLRGPVCNLFVIAAYLPHRGRVSPSQDDTIADIQNILSKVPSRDCVCMMGDFNEQVESNIKGITGKWTGGPPSTNAEKITDMLRFNKLAAVNTMYQPKKHQSVCTFLQTQHKGNEDINANANDFGAYVNQEVRAKYKRRWYKGTVEALLTGQGQQPKWIVRFSDGHAMRCNEKQLRKMLVITKKKQIGRQLDYVFISKRWLSSIEKCKVRWGPSIHRSAHGRKSDHALLSCTFKWRIRSYKTQKCKDFEVLKQETDMMTGLPVPNPYIEKFEATIQSKLQELGHSQADDATKFYEDMCSAIRHAIDNTLPDVERSKRARRQVSEKTKEIYKRRSRGEIRTNAQFKAMQAKVKQAGMDDFKAWVQQQGEVMSDANERGDTKKIYQVVKTLAGTSEKPPTNLTTDGNNNILSCAEDVATRWFGFLKNKFDATDREKFERPDMTPLPPTQGQESLTEEEINKGLHKMSSNKACGPDHIPVEIFKRSPKCNELLIKLIQKIWQSEQVPTTFAEATFTMIYKNKGSSDDPTKYRCIGLLNHAYKILSQCLLARLEDQTKHYLSDWQAGFREKRGCRDNVLILRTIYDAMLQRGKPLYITFIDYTAAFDSVSHKFLDEALKEAGATNKTRAIFRAVYAAATARTVVKDTDGKRVLSEAFNINRGVVQGDITSPLYFILALELLLKRHDARTNKGIEFGNTKIHTLGYADDAALIDSSLEISTSRVTTIAQGSERDADMVISIPKTEVMHVCEQGEVSKTTQEEAKKICKFKCLNVGCDKVFHNAHGAKCHAGKCKWRNYYTIDRILACKGKPGSRQFKVRWEGYGPEHDTWEPRKNIVPFWVMEYLKANQLYDYEHAHRCPRCDKPLKSARGVKMHLRSCTHDNIYGTNVADQDFRGRVADAQVKINKMKQAQSCKAKVQCGGHDLCNTFLFKYLGSIFAADGSQMHDVKRRAAMAMDRCGQLSHVLGSTAIPMHLKFSIYHAAVCSLLTYGCEAWNLSEKIKAKINGCNAKCLSHFTNLNAHEEASARTRSIDLVGLIRQRRYRWLGHILRLKGNRLVKDAVKMQFEMGLPGNICMDAPAHLSFEELTELAQDRKAWKEGLPQLHQRRPHRTDHGSPLIPSPSSPVLVPPPNMTIQQQHQITNMTEFQMEHAQLRLHNPQLKMPPSLVQVLHTQYPINHDNTTTTDTVITPPITPYMPPIVTPTITRWSYIKPMLYPPPLITTASPTHQTSQNNQLKIQLHSKWRNKFKSKLRLHMQSPPRTGSTIALAAPPTTSNSSNSTTTYPTTPNTGCWE